MLTEDNTHPPDCREPALGRLLSGYLARQLDAEQEDAFERHYFSCDACAKEIRFHQALVDAVKEVGHPEEKRRSRLFWPVVAGSGALAAVLALFLLLPALSSREPVLLQLEGGFRGPSSQTSLVRADRPIELSMSVLGSRRDGITYDVSVIDARGASVFHAEGIEPAGASDVRLLIPEGVLGPGPYEVHLLERGASLSEPMEWHYTFEVLPR